ncbi:MAG TPA: hypothetical protein VK616_13395 [Flavitalea sp.]|nr:hypothetical protein [Flavitalea sp.]HTF28502.1 hypothetical protein [Flavitalea sp.]
MFLLQKAFRKNKEEYSDGNATKMIAIQKKMADPDIQSTLLFLSLLIILFPFLFKSIKDIFHRDLVLANLKLISSQPSYLLNRQFNI